MVDESSLCTHPGPLALRDEILEDFIDDFVNEWKPPSFHIFLVVHSSNDTIEEELRKSHRYASIKIPQLGNPLF